MLLHTNVNMNKTYFKALKQQTLYVPITSQQLERHVENCGRLTRIGIPEFRM